jgi:hypothetical protein
MKLSILVTVLAIFLLVCPLVFAEDDKEDQPSLADIISSLASAIPQAIFNFILGMFNQSHQPLLDLIKKMLSENIDLAFFKGTWQYFVYIISLFYGLLLLYSGFNFIVSGHDSVKRQNAKLWLQNTLVMAILTQASFFLYSAVLDLSSGITNGVLSLIDSSFFIVKPDNIINFGFNFFMTFFYTLTLNTTLMFLTMRYIVVIAGVALCPIGIFLYFIEPLKGYGQLILNFLGICIFTTFIDSIILLTCSGLLQVTVFQNCKIVVLIAGFTIVNFAMFYFMLFSAIKSAFKTATQVTFTIAWFAKWFA